MNASEFVRTYAGRGVQTWESAALNLARQGRLTSREWIPIELSDGHNKATIYVQNDFLAIGPKSDSIRLPLTSSGAQNILNLYGWLLPTQAIVYQINRNARTRLNPSALPNRGPDLNQFYEHDRILDSQIRDNSLVTGAKKHVIVSNIASPGKQVIYGWFRPGTAEPIQGKSNIHGDTYVDYSHGIQAVGPIAVVNGKEIKTADLYQHPALSRLVSNEGPIRVPRYSSNVGIGSPVGPGAGVSIGPILLGAALLGGIYYGYTKRWFR